ncbi:MAG: T9SS type A sorting domain-containing protein, partial [Ignavibacteriaceae bacterium]|nr:T9SS type A sorting domain-containing protein [Ignavibacteriaceae bacterium]
LALQGNNIYAGIFGNGIYLSTDNGTSWSDVNNGLTNKYVSSIAVKGNNIFVGAGLGNGESGVFLSGNNGANWTKINNGLTDTLVSAITVSDDNVFAGTASGTFISTDNGSDWSLVKNGLPVNTYVRSLNGSQDRIYAGTDKDGIYFSTDDGLSWASLNNGLPVSNILTVANNGNNLLAGTNGDGVYQSTDNGASWVESSSGIINTSINSMLLSGNNIFSAAGNEGIYLSSNDGTSWSHLKNGMPDTYIYTLASGANNIFAGTSSSGIIVSTNNGLGWTTANTGLSSPNSENFISLTPFGDNLLAGTYEGRVYITDNNKISWNCIGDFGAARSINAMAISGSYIFAAIGQGNGSGGVWRTSDYGTNWIQMNSGLFALNDVYDIAVCGNNIIARVTGDGAGESGIFISSDNCNSWKQIKYNGVSLTGESPLSVSGNEIFFGTSYYSTDNGVTWNTISVDGMSGLTVNAMVFNSDKVFAGTNGQGVWTRLQSDVLPVELSAFTVSVKTNSIVINWKTATELNNFGFEVERADYNNNSAATDWESLAFIKGAGSSNSTKEYDYSDIKTNGNGKFLYRLKQIDNNGKVKYSNVIEISVHFGPQTYSLENNFPNPFNPSTVIKYSLPFDSNVKLTIYNTLGMTVKELFTEVQPAGTHEYNFNANGLSSGVYLYTIQASSTSGTQKFQSTKKMILMK